MSIVRVIKENISTRKEYRWVSFAYFSYAVSLVVVLWFFPLEPNLLLLVVLLMIMVYLGSLINLMVRALRRIEERLDKLDKLDSL